MKDGITENLNDIYEEIGGRAEEVFGFTKIRGVAIEILRYMDDALEIHPGKWSLSALNNVKTITTLTDKEEGVKGVTVIIINTGGGGNFREFVCKVNNATNRLHQLMTGKDKCHEKTCPADPRGKEYGQGKAKDLTIGRLLVKTENRLAQERSQPNQNIAFATARSYTTNAEQKTIIKEWGEGGSEDYKKKGGNNSTVCCRNGRNGWKRSRHTRTESQDE